MVRVKNYLEGDLLDCLLEGFQIIDFDWKYIFINNAAAVHGKYSKKELLGKTMMEMYPGIEKSPLFEKLTLCMTKRTPLKMENHFSYPNGKKQWFELRIEPIPKGIFILSIDITDKKKAETKLKKFNKILEKRIQQRTNLLQEKNKDITDSISYAKRIQKAKLVPEKTIHSSFNDSFVLLKPKDIVSGDFYFYHQNSKFTYIAAADCTGHGVPGAFMSMLCMEKLDLALTKTHDTAEILEIVNTEVNNALNQVESDHQSNDGMDIALCAVNTKDNFIEFAGANRPLWIIRNGKSEIEEIKGTRTGIGGHAEFHQPITSSKIDVHEGDSFYLFSDGYPDTFGGTSNKKLTIKRFKELLLDSHQKPMKDQKNYLNNFIEDWKGDIEQVDDILVIGMRM